MFGWFVYLLFVWLFVSIDNLFCVCLHLVCVCCKLVCVGVY